MRKLTLSKAETLVQVKAIGASREDLQALGEEYGFGLLGLDNFAAPAEEENTGIPGEEEAKKINAILKSCLFEVMQEQGLISKASPTAPSGFKEDKIVKRLTEAYEVALDEIFPEE